MVGRDIIMEGIIWRGCGGTKGIGSRRTSGREGMEVGV